ncbi:pyridoxal phosphate-dependent aminotransferase [Alienimonas sp. DA493]|uniref:pyridoxal phosphate-dependent aminotransferase n=1 Tax=Alienimonas sp. DA493 TaxID=3373605 RepID=UPI003755107D
MAAAFTFSDRARGIDASGIRKVFDLAAQLEDPINLSIGQPHYPVPDAVKAAIADAVAHDRNAYSPSQGIAPLVSRLQADVDETFGHADRRAFVTSGTSGGLMLALSALVNPGDEVVAFDPYFVMYKHLTTLCGGTCKFVDTYPDFRIDVEKVRAAIGPRTKAILCNSPANPTGAVMTEAEARGLAELSRETGVPLISDEIYELFCHDGEFVSPAKYDENCLVVGGYSKTYGMTGLRVGYAHGPAALIEQMIKLQQYTFVCSPQPAQWGALAALDVDMSARATEYRGKRDLLAGLIGENFPVRGADGAFYMFVPAPWGTGSEFVAECIKEGLLVIPGNVFSEQDTHLRISYAATDDTIRRGADVLNRLAERGPAVG